MTSKVATLQLKNSSGFYDIIDMDPFFFSFNEYTFSPYYCRIHSEACCPTGAFPPLIPLRRDRNVIRFLKGCLAAMFEEDSVVGISSGLLCYYFLKNEKRS